MLILLGSKVIFQDNFAKLTGKIEVKASSNPGNSYNQTVATLNYPSGYNKNNTTVIGLLQKNADSDSAALVQEFGASAVNASSSSVLCSFPARVLLQDSNILIHFYNIGSAKNVAYTLTLKKE